MIYLPIVFLLPFQPPVKTWSTNCFYRKVRKIDIEEEEEEEEEEEGILLVYS